MVRFNYYSFDLWETLITRNPEFKEKRDKIFYDLFNPNGYDQAYVSELVSDTGKRGSKCSELTGVQFTCRQMIFSVLNELDFKDITANSLSLIEHRIQELFLNNPPILLPDVKEVLKELFERDCTLSLLSNTGYILGKTLTKSLTQLSIKKYFSNMIYSDVLGLSKPNPLLFDHLLKVNDLDNPTLLLHVGDNPYADGNCVKSGIHYFLANKNLTELLK